MFGPRRLHEDLVELLRVEREQTRALLAASYEMMERSIERTMTRHAEMTERIVQSFAAAMESLSPRREEADYEPPEPLAPLPGEVVEAIRIVADGDEHELEAEARAMLASGEEPAEVAKAIRTGTPTYDL